MVRRNVKILCALGLSFPALMGPLFAAGAAEDQPSPGDSQPIPALSTPENKKGADTALERGKNLVQQGRFEEARRVLGEALKQTPDSAQLHYWLGSAYMKQKQFDEGLVELERSVQRSPENVRLKLELAKAYEEAGRRERAVKTYQAVLAADAEQIEARLRLGRIYEADGNVDQAIANLEGVVARGKDSPLAREANGRLTRLFASKAEAVAGELSQGKGKGDIEGAIDLGKRLVFRRQLDDAQKVLDQVVERAPDNAEGQYWLAQVYITRKKFGEGLTGLERSVALAPQNLRLKDELAKAYERAGRLPDAERIYGELAAQKADAKIAALAVHRLGLVRGLRFLEADEFDKAVAEYDALLKGEPKDRNALLELKLHALTGQGKLDEADRVARQLLDLAPDDAELHMRIAAIYERQGDAARARQIYADLLGKNPTGDVARRALGRLGLDAGLDLVRQKRFDDAVAAFKRVLEVAPNVPEVYLNIGRVYHQQQRYDEAEAAYRQALALDKNNLEARLRLGMLYTETTQIDKAIETLEVVAKQAGRSPAAGQVNKLLGNLRVRKAQREAEQLRAGGGDVKEALDFGKRLVNERNAAAAVPLLQAVVARAPDDPQGHYWLGQAQIGGGKPAAGIAEIERSVALAPGNVILLNQLGEAYQSIGRFKDAERVLGQVAEQAENKELARRARDRVALAHAQGLMQAGDYAGALAAYEGLLTAKPDDISLLNQKADALFAQNRNKEAEAVYDHVLELRPRDAGVRLDLARKYQEHGNKDKAIALYREVVDIAPARIEAWLTLGALYQDAERYEDAIDALSEARQRGKGTPQGRAAAAQFNVLKKTIIARGTKLIDQGKLDDAQSLFQKLLEHEPDDAQGYYWLSQVHHKRESYRDEVAALEKAAELQPGNIRLQQSLAYAYADAAMLHKAEQALLKVLEQIPYNSEARFRLADIYDKRGERAQARTELVKLLNMDPPADWRDKVLDKLGLAEGREHVQRNELDQAVRSFQQVLEIAPDEPKANKAVADVYTQQKRYPEAEAIYEKLLQLDPADMNVQLALAEIYAATDREAQAVEKYHYVASARPDAPEGRKADGEMKRLLVAKAEREIDRAGKLRDPQRIEDELAPIGIDMVEKGASDAGDKIFSYLLKLRPDSAKAHYWLGQAEVGAKRYTDALVLIKRAVELDPDEPLYRYGLGRVYRDAGLYRQAEQALQEAQARDPGNADILFDLAALYERRGATEQARDQYARVLAIHPSPENRRRALDALGLAEAERLLGQGHLDEALQILEPLATLIPKEPATNLVLGIVYQRQQRYGAAEAAYRRVLELEPDNVKARLQLGRLYAEINRIDEAMPLLEEVVARKDADEASRRDAAGQLGQLYSRSAQRETAALNQGMGDVAKAVDLGKQLVFRRRDEDALKLLGAVVHQAPENPEGHYWLGQALLNRGDTDKGLAEIERSVALAPDNVLLKNELGKAYERVQRLTDAKRAYQEVAASGNKDLAPQAERRLGLVRGQLFAEAGNYEAALREYDALSQALPDDVGLLGERGRILAALGRNDEADQTFKRALEIAPDNLNVRIRLASVYQARKDLPKLMEQMAKIIEIAPRSKEAEQARKLLGYDKGVERMEKAPAEALTIFEDLQKAVPGDPLVHLQLGKIYFGQRRYADSQQALEKAVELDPDLQEGHFLLGRIYQGFLNEDRAIRSFEKVVALDRTSDFGKQAMSKLIPLYASRAQRFRTSGEVQDAMTEYEKLIANDPDSAFAHYNLALLYGMSGRNTESLAQFNEVLRIDPNNAGAYEYIGRLNLTDQHYDRAIEAFARAVSLQEDPRRTEDDVRSLILALSQQMLDDDRPFSAMRQLEQLHAQGLGSERSYFTLGMIYRTQGEFDKAIEAFREAVNRSPDNIILRYNLAALYERTNQDDLALYQYREIVARGEAGNPYVEQARQRMDYVADQLRLFTSTLAYDLTIGESVLQEQDLANTGAANSSFSSRLFYNLATRFRPTDSLNLTLNTGFIYVGNHSTQDDSLVPRVGFAGRLNYPNVFYNANVNVADSRGLLLDTYSGRSYNVNLAGGMRIKDPLEWLRNFGRDKSEQEQAESDIERSPDTAHPEEPDLTNSRLRDALQDAYEQLYPEEKRRVVPKEEETVRRYVVKKGDTLWDIAEQLLFDPFLWPEIWQENPNIKNPHLIFPGDRITLFYIGEKPVILIERAGEHVEPPPMFEPFTPEEKAQRKEQVARSVEDSMGLYEKARELMRQDRLDEALELFELILTIVPDDPLTNLNAGIIYHRQLRYDLAEASYLKALEADPSNLTARLQLGRLYSDMGRLDEAIAAFEQVLHDGPGSSEAGTAGELIVGLYERKARQVFDQPKLSAQDIETLTGIGGKLFEMRAYGSAQRVFEDLTARQPEYAAGHYWLARVYLQRQDAQGAVREAEASVTHAPDNAEYQLQLARAYRAADRLQEAETAYHELAKMTAAAEVQSAAQRELALVQAAEQAAAGKYPEAIDIYNTLLKQYPEDPEILAQAAAAYEGLGKLPEAVDAYTRAVTAAPDDIQLRLQLAAAYERLEQQKEAREQLSKVVAMAPDEATRRAALDQLGLQRGLDLLQQGHLDEALAVLQGVLEAVPDEPLALLNVGVIYQEQGKYVEAETTFQRLLDVDPRNLNALLRLGLVYAETGRIEKAITTLERVVSRGNGTQAAEKAAAKLRELEEERLANLTSGELEKTEPVAKTIQANVFYNNTDLTVISVAETFGYGVGFDFVYPSIRWGNWDLNYRYAIQDNEHPLGTDYAYRSHDLSLSVSRPVPNLFGLFGSGENVPGLIGSLSLSREYRGYQNADTNARVRTGFSRRRQNVVDSLGLSFTYRLHDRLSLSLSLSKSRQRSNLPVGLVFNPGGIPVAYQSLGLGDFTTQSIDLGLQFRF